MDELSEKNGKPIDDEFYNLLDNLEKAKIAGDSKDIKAVCYAISDKVKAYGSANIFTNKPLTPYAVFRHDFADGLTKVFKHDFPELESALSNMSIAE